MQHRIALDLHHAAPDASSEERFLLGSAIVAIAAEHICPAQLAEFDRLFD